MASCEQLTENKAGGSGSRLRISAYTTMNLMEYARNPRMTMNTKEKSLHIWRRTGKTWFILKEEHERLDLRFEEEKQETWRHIRWRLEPGTLRLRSRRTNYWTATFGPACKKLQSAYIVMRQHTLPLKPLNYPATHVNYFQAVVFSPLSKKMAININLLSIASLPDDV